MKRSRAVTFADVCRLALKLPDVEQGLSYGRPALKVQGKIFVGFNEELESIALRMSFDGREALMAQDPETFYITDHYLKYQWVLVRLANVRRDELPELLQIGYREALPAKRRAARSLTQYARESKRSGPPRNDRERSRDAAAPAARELHG